MKIRFRVAASMVWRASYLKGVFGFPVGVILVALNSRRLFLRAMSCVLQKYRV